MNVISLLASVGVATRPNESRIEATVRLVG